MQTNPSLLFLALAEREVPAFLHMSRVLAHEGVDSAVVTWLPRLAVDGVVALADLAEPDQPAELEPTLRAAGFAFPSMVADFDRDWHFASVGQKERHVVRVFTALKRHLDTSPTTHLVTSVGGETPRVIADAVARSRGLKRLYFNALPLPGRFVLLPSLDAPFISWEDDGRPSPSERAAANVLPSVDDPFPPEATGLDLIREGMRRTMELGAARRDLYPPAWLRHRIAITGRQRLLSRWPSSTPPEQAASGETVRVLYPLHDERDFQVAVRERHAIPQIMLLRYVSSILPPGCLLEVKPHPLHRADHHPILWRELARRPNVRFLAPSKSASEAIADADVVLTLASSLGFEALLVGKPVVCYGSPFYSKRGLTIDVSDPREIATSVIDAQARRTAKVAIASLLDDMHHKSWPGQFTPLNTNSTNLDFLSVAISEALEC